MYCQNCGTQNDDSVNFCMNCGAALQRAQPFAQPSCAPEESSQRALREQAKSPLFLAGGIIFSTALLFQLISAVLGKGGLMNFVDTYMAMALKYGGYEAGRYLSELQDAIGMIGGGMTVGAIIGMIPDILLAVGIWMTFAAAKNPHGAMSTTGLTIIKVVTIVQMVFCCIGLLALAAGEVIVMIAVTAYADEALPIFLVLLFLLVVLAVFEILYYIKLIGTVNSMVSAVRQGQGGRNVSLYVAVICFFAGAWCLVTSFSGNAFGILGGLCRTASWIIFGIYLIMYRGKANLLESAYTLSAGASGMPAAYPAEEPQPRYAQAAPQPPVVQPFVPQKAPKDGTTVLSENSYYAQETTLLTSEPSITVRLIRVKDGTVVTVALPQFRIGKDPASSDYFIADNTAISRQHADILVHDNRAFVKDLDSTNHVYINDQPITPNQEVPLANGMELRLGDEKFRVEIV